VSRLAYSANRRRARRAKRAAAKPRRHRLFLPPASTVDQTVDLTSMSAAMVDRLFWRAGFGPTQADRTAWTGKPVKDAVNWLLTTPAGVSGVPGTNGGKAFDPTGDDTDLVLSWVDRMVRSTNPFPERLGFFWHRHFANSRASVSPPQLLMQQNDLFRKYSDLAANPTASFKDLTHEVTINPSMLRFLTGEYNVKGAPNENYGRELMELFSLGITNAAGAANYSEDDVKQLAKAFSGWQIDDSNPDAVTSYFTPDRWYNGPKIVFGKFGNYHYDDAVDLVLAHPNHPAFLLTKLWNEFVATPPDAATLAKLVSTYTSSGLQIKPVIQQILTDPALFASLSEPNLVKPPIVYVVGTMRALGAGVTDTSATDHLDDMGQLPYFPPTVAGWEGGLSWLNTNTALARFGFAASLISNATIDDVPGETASSAYDRAYAAVGQPWLSSATQAAIRDFSNRAGSGTSKLRKERQLMLRALMLAGPDGQVM